MQMPVCMCACACVYTRMAGTGFAVMEPKPPALPPAPVIQPRTQARGRRCCRPRARQDGHRSSRGMQRREVLAQLSSAAGRPCGKTGLGCSHRWPPDGTRPQADPSASSGAREAQASDCWRELPWGHGQGQARGCFCSGHGEGGKAEHREATSVGCRVAAPRERGAQECGTSVPRVLGPAASLGVQTPPPGVCFLPGRPSTPVFQVLLPPWASGYRHLVPQRCKPTGGEVDVCWVRQWCFPRDARGASP